MQNPFRKFFSFTDREFKGMLVLLGLIVVIAAAMYVQERLVKLPENDYAALDRIIALQEQDTNSTKEKYDAAPEISDQGTPESSSIRKERFAFDPNGLTEEDWVRLGLSPAQAKVIKKYEIKGGRFRTKKDVQKMIVISPRLYAELEPYIHIAGNNNLIQPAATTERQQRYAIELNRADTTALRELPGIGSAFARRIIAYRQKLGGFHHMNQLLEVYGLDQQRFDVFAGLLSVDTTHLIKININTADEITLRKHPYIIAAVAKALVNYRHMHGPFHKLTDIKGCQLIDAELYRKLVPYLTL
jgi:DNA uptake protein ComE-like DNA-binding protein